MQKESAIDFLQLWHQCETVLPKFQEHDMFPCVCEQRACHLALETRSCLLAALLDHCEAEESDKYNEAMAKLPPADCREVTDETHPPMTITLENTHGQPHDFVLTNKQYMSQVALHKLPQSSKGLDLWGTRCTHASRHTYSCIFPDESLEYVCVPLVYSHMQTWLDGHGQMHSYAHVNQ